MSLKPIPKTAKGTDGDPSSTDGADPAVVVEGPTPGMVECYVLQRFKERAGDEPYEAGEFAEFTIERAAQLRLQGLVGDEPEPEPEAEPRRRRRAAQ